MATNLADLRDQLLFDLAEIKQALAAVYMTIEMNPPKVHLWSLLEDRDEAAEDTLAIAEERLMTSFPAVKFDFTTIHLRGRDPIQFIPGGAIPVQFSANHKMLMRHFFRAMTATAHGKP